MGVPSMGLNTDTGVQSVRLTSWLSFTVTRCTYPETREVIG